MIQESLQEIGLSKNESKIYLMLLNSGPSPVGMISSETGIHRRNIYDSIERLKEKGFVSWVLKNNRKYFEAVDPKRILDIFEERKERIKEMIPRLRKREKPVQDIRVYTGSEGRKIIFKDKLSYKEEQLVLGAHAPSERNLKNIEIFHKKRIVKKIPLKMLFPSSEASAAAYFARLKYVKARILPKLLSKSPIAINIYGNKVVFLMGSEEKSEMSIVIEDKSLAEDFKNYFYALWKVSASLFSKQPEHN